jgi:[acyl-carrier-protein] S-malonyltransferase
MGKEWVREFEKAREIFEEADEILQFSLSRFCFEGPEDVLTRTLYAQPAIFVTSLAFLSVLEEKWPEVKPDFVAGLSLGEFSALAACGSLSFSEGLRLVKARAEWMEKAASHTRGAMISVLGLSEQDCRALVKESGAELANLNAPDQFVVSGEQSAVECAAGLAEGMGAKRVIRLKVGGAFHSSLMKEAREGLQEALTKTSIHAPRCTFVANVSAQSEHEPERIRALLAEQLTSPVRWIETMEHARNQGNRRFIEVGPGRVLKGLTRRIDASLEVLSLEKVSDLEAVSSALQKV